LQFLKTFVKVPNHTVFSGDKAAAPHWPHPNFGIAKKKKKEIGGKKEKKKKSFEFALVKPPKK
jgi:hypothetical protein